MRLLVIGLALAVVTGCGGSNGGPGPAPTPASIALNASSSGTINALTTTRTLTATVRDANQDVINNASVNWTASPGGVVSLSSSTGLTTTLTAIGNGATTVTATAGTVNATHNVTVAQDFASLNLSPNPGTVNVGGTLQLVATGRDPLGSALASVGTVNYASNDDTKATVNGSGLVSGHAAGTVQISGSATVGGVTRNATTNVTVGTQMFPSTAQVTAGNTTNTFTPQTVDIATGGTVTWVFGQLTHNVTFGAQTGAPQSIATTVNAQVPRTFNTAGTFDYNCTVHPGMSGTVVVH
ncbi:MAG TPA: Ig-like domain-containing protein [Gemmatimonadaceae bacterium]|nr:Ig-like domain-containing protein [Gemmatimonadaceae bacterium]